MKSCEVREANTICAAAARMRGRGIISWPVESEVVTLGGGAWVDDGGGNEMTGETGRVLIGG